ncbi:Hypothetical protein SMAX5B_022604 [Scophthalmus maximus]|uniref:Uncharacterized protein n=1 Tax=Scophthalmus maximus TaxID=52904 RepID=A0A2U9C389_SCOMX|nr:Hypothetical protein SMAX5B_022604 [Scophthalmus maximus]
MPKYGNQERTIIDLVGVWRTERHTNGEERKAGEEKLLKAEELCNATRINTELFGLPPAAMRSHEELGHKGPRTRCAIIMFSVFIFHCTTAGRRRLRRRLSVACIE